MHALTARVTAQDWLNAVLRREILHGEFDLAGGGKSAWYLDCRNVVYGVDLPLLTSLVDHLVADIEPDAIGGVGFGALPVAVHLAYRRGVKSFAVRLETKGHGRVGLLVGPLRSGDRVVLVEDVFTTGSSVCAAVEALQAAGVEVAAVACIVNRGNPTLNAVYGVPFRSLLTSAALGEE